MDKSFYLGSVSDVIEDHVKDGNFDINKLLTLEHEGSVVNILCANCLTILEGAQQNAEALAKAADIELPENLSGKYFQTTSCFVCNKTGEDINVKLRDVKELTN